MVLGRPSRVRDAEEAKVHGRRRVARVHACYKRIEKYMGFRNQGNCHVEREHVEGAEGMLFPMRRESLRFVIAVGYDGRRKRICYA